MTIKQRYKGVIEWFEHNVPVAETELHYRSPFELLVAVILSAQCTDKRINMVTPALFEAYPTAEAMAKATADDIFEYIKSVTFPNNKARALVGMANMLVDKYGGQVPGTLEELTRIPGVGRKTANVILSVIFGKATLVANIPESLIGKAHHWLILHGRYVCTARKPKCHECGVRPYCKYYSTNAE